MTRRRTPRPNPETLIAELRQAQADLQAQNAALRYSQTAAEGAADRFVTLFSNVPLALLVVDPRLQILQYNAHALALLQPQESDPPLHYLDPFIEPAALDRVRQGLHTASAEGRCVLGELRLRAGSNGAFLGDLHVAHLDNAGEETDGYLCAIVDQTPQIAQRQAQKLQAIGTLAGGIAHDFNNILGAILGNARLALDEGALPVNAAASLAEIDRAARRARELVRQILTFSRNDGVQRTPTALGRLTQDALRLVRVSLPPGIALQVQIDPDVPDTLADPTQIEQVVLNLATNAVHAMTPGGGTLTVHVAAGANGWPELRVSDTGCGMDAAVQARVFEPFFTTKPVGQGTGLGLAVVHGIVQAHQGQVQIDSAPGVGTTVVVRWPPAPQTPTRLTVVPAVQGSVPIEPDAPDAPSKTDVPGTPAGARVAYIDDDEALVFLVRRVLTRAGYRVHTYTDPQAALTDLRADPLRFDALITDYNMPGTSGVAVLQTVAELNPGLPTALASGYVTAEIEQAARAAGARALIHKPDDTQVLCDTLRALLSANPPKPTV